MSGAQSHWPAATDGISHLVLDLDYEVPGRFMTRRKTLQLDLVDYPGEWLADFPLLSLSYEEWSKRVLAQAQQGPRAEMIGCYRETIEALPWSAGEEHLEKITRVWADYLALAHSEGLVLNQPARLLRPANLENSPILRLVPLPADKLSYPVADILRKKYAQYIKHAVLPFYKDHFSKLDRQIVLVDILRTLELGSNAYDELMLGLRSVLQVFRYGNGSFFDRLRGHRTSHLLFAATKADHVTRGDRSNLRDMLRKIVRFVDDDNQLRRSVKHTDSIALASVQSTEDRMTVQTPKREVLYGRPDGRDEAAWDPGGIPLDIPPDWNELGFQFLEFQPQAMHEALYEGFPSINLGRALNFLIGEDMQ
jgi:predicted YcjX-like family ATPase